MAIRAALSSSVRYGRALISAMACFLTASRSAGACASLSLRASATRVSILGLSVAASIWSMKSFFCSSVRYGRALTAFFASSFAWARASAAAYTKLEPGIGVSAVPSGYETVVVPSASTVMVASAGRSGLVARIKSRTASFSASVRLLGLVTATLLAGVATSNFSAAVFGRTTSEAGRLLVVPSA